MALTARTNNQAPHPHLVRVLKLGIWRPESDQRGIYVGYAKRGDIERVEQLLIERRARMFRS